MPSTALLIMDVQQGIVDRFPDASGTMLDALDRAARAARSAGIPVVYVRVAFRDELPEISRRNRSFSAIADAGGGFGDTDPASQIHPAIAAQPGDIVVVKKRVSAFTGSDL